MLAAAVNMYSCIYDLSMAAPAIVYGSPAQLNAANDSISTGFERWLICFNNGHST